MSFAQILVVSSASTLLGLYFKMLILKFLFLFVVHLAEARDFYVGK